jgi:hypothetical protein
MKSHFRGLARQRGVEPFPHAAKTQYGSLNERHADTSRIVIARIHPAGGQLRESAVDLDSRQ